MVNNKKAISPVVATALLLVVAVVAVVGFQTWFNTYNSGQYANIEQQSDSGSPLTMERLEISDSGAGMKLYVKNIAASNVTVNSISVSVDGSEVCGYGADIAVLEDVTIFNNASCDNTLQKGTAYEVVVVSPKGPFSATLIAK